MPNLPAPLLAVQALPTQDNQPASLPASPASPANRDPAFLPSSNLVCIACRIQPPVLDAVIAAVAYAFPWSGLMAQFKFGNAPGLARVFAELLLQTPGVLPALAALQKGDWLLPLPLSTERLRQRGFNQSWELVKRLAALASLPIFPARLDAQLLLRVRHGDPQNALPRSERLANVHNAYAVEPLRISALQGRRVVLVDDVMTTGASLNSAAFALRQAGAVQVTALVVARTAPYD